MQEVVETKHPHSKLTHQLEYKIDSMNNIKYILIGIAFISLASCSKVTSDANKAGKLTNKSIEKTNQLKLKDAEKLYKKSREIIDKYDNHKKSSKFYDVYLEERDKGKIKASDR